MISLEPFCFSTNNVPGKDLIRALDLAKTFGFSHVELAAIDGISEQIDVEQLSPQLLRRIHRELERRNLTCYAVSGHCDMTDDYAFFKLLKKIQFAGEIGARVLNTRCGPKSRYAKFLDRVKEAADLASSYGVMLHLESYGDIVGPAKECGPVFREIGLENVRFTYDAGNTFRFARGNICIDEDIRQATVVPSYLHMKDTCIRDGWIYQTPVGAGSLDIPKLLLALEQHTAILPCSLEIPLSFRVRYHDLAFDFLNPSDDEICHSIEQSILYLNEIANIKL